MGAELMSNDMAEDGYISDSEAFDSVVQVLDAVRMAPSLVAPSDRDQYDTLLSIVDPGKKMDSDKEALLVTALKALAGAVSKIDIIFHGSLLSNIFAMRIWNYGVDARNALLELITSLKIVVFVECMLGIQTDDIGEFMGNLLMAKVVDLLTDLDVNITWEDILQEEQNKGIFDMELEDLEEDVDKDGKDGRKPLEDNNRAFKGNAFAEKLDGLMVVVCEHLKSRADDGHLFQEFGMLMDIFKRSVLKLHKSKFAQFIMFYACSLDPDDCGVKFADILTDVFVNKSEDPTSRMSAVSYLASYLSRAKFISPPIVMRILKRLVDWCFDYCRFQNVQEKIINPKIHQVFYAGCQAVMYILCFRMRSIMDYPDLRSLLFHMPLGFILSHPLDPLKVCLPSIVQEFLRQAKAARLFNASVPSIYENSLESELSKAFGGTERLDMFFPFDPYLLKDSDRFMRPNFEFWSMVKTTYSNCNSEEDDEEFDDLDAPDFAENVGSYEDNNLGFESEDEDDLGYSMNKMSITPKSAFQYPAATDFQVPSRMPARIRPSVSPPTW